VYNGGAGLLSYPVYQIRVYRESWFIVLPGISNPVYTVRVGLLSYPVYQIRVYRESWFIVLPGISNPRIP